MTKQTQNREWIKKTILASKVLLTIFVTLAVSACGSRDISFDLLAESATFNQNSAEVNGKIDILWVNASILAHR